MSDQPPTGPLTPVQYQRMQELLSKSQIAPGLTAEEYAELEALHAQATAYASGWSADPAAAFEASLSGLQALANAVRSIAALTPVGHALDPALKQVDAALLTSGRAVHEPEPVPEMPPAPSEPGTAPPNGSGGSSVPVNRDVPYVSGTGQIGSSLNCTMGNWLGEPTSYSYRWLANGTAVAQNGANYVVQGSDQGRSITCEVTASNPAGSATAPPSNAVYVQ
jgi:hypothetical protein